MSLKIRRAVSQRGTKLKRQDSVSARRSLSIPQTIQRAAGLTPERKNADAQWNAFTLTAATAYSQILSAVAIGSDNSNRVGRKILVESIRLKLSLYVSSASSLSNIRTLVVRDWGSQATIPSWTDIMATTITESDYNTSNTERFQILMDRYDQVGNANQSSLKIDRKIKLRSKKPTQYIGTTAGVASSGVGQIYLYIMSDNNVGYVAGVGSLRSGGDLFYRMTFYDA